MTATGSLEVITTKLYVDGQEMDSSDDGTNYVINTCEWPNGPHTLFATAMALSALPGPSGDYPISVGRSVSAYVPVTFSNLITQIAFTEPFFEPSLGQTQQVTAAFAANVNWTLQIIDESTNTVGNASGSGISMQFNWDGTGDGGTNIPDGVYHYLITAATNGQSFGASFSGGDSASIASSASLSESSDSMILWAAPVDGSGDAVPFTLYPLGTDTNNLIIYEAPATRPSLRRESGSNSRFGFALDSGGGETPSGFGGPSSQAAIAPIRPPTAPVKNQVGNYGIGYYTFPVSFTNNIPKNGIPPPVTGVVHLDGCSTCSQSISDHIPNADTTAVSMIQTMKKLGWKLAFHKADVDLSLNSIRRSDQGYSGGEIFTQATIGLFMDHGSYGDDPDYSAGSSGAKNTYFDSPNPGDAANSWLRMCQFGFGGNLKWMAILACNCLCDPNYSSMVSHGAIPLKTTHLLCGTSTIAAMEENIGAYWAKNMIKNNQKVKDAWFDAGRAGYAEAENSSLNTIIFRVTGYSECFNDTVKVNTGPTSPSAAPGNLVKEDKQVYP